tara:strand:+ start:529 stop:1113 length:585 start_codon:yes stop_codon:yes gene_type:complete
MKKVSLLCMSMLIVIIGSQSSQAGGWGDYWLEIAPGFQIIRANGFDIGLGDEDGFVIYAPEKGGKSGPISGYIVTPDRILLRTTGQKPRNNFPGDTFVLADPSVEYFFIVDRSDEALRGPLTLPEFKADPHVALLSDLIWTIPTNPDPGRMQRRAVEFFFVIVSVVIICVVLFVVMIFKIGRTFLSKTPTTDAE